MSNNLVLRQAGLRQVTCIVHERRLRLYGIVTRLPAEDPAHRILIAEIRVSGLCRGGAYTLRGCVMWSHICGMQAWAWCVLHFPTCTVENVIKKGYFRKYNGLYRNVQLVRKSLKFYIIYIISLLQRIM